MFKSFKSALSDDRMRSIIDEAVSAAESGDEDDCRDALRPLLRAQRHQQDAALYLLRAIHDRQLPIDLAAEIIGEIHKAHPGNAMVLHSIGASFEGAIDIDQLNAPPPDNPLFRDIVDELTELSRQTDPGVPEPEILGGLATAAHRVGRQRDAVAEQSYRRLVDIEPQNSSHHYNLGLYYKNRGRFREGMLANQRAASLVDEPVESYEWNLGICATGAGEAAVALEVWKRMGQTIEMGRFDLPDGGYPMCKVRLAERPLAERSADNDDPGLEETIWIERLSPCHGIIRSVLYQDLGVDYGDVVLFDGAPITYHTYGDNEYPVFPHLATLRRRHYRIFDFAGTQDDAGRIADTSDDLDREAIVYSHTENYRTLCASCWRDPDLDHEVHAGEEKHVVTGRIAMPGDVDAGTFLQQLDRAVAARTPCRIYAPDLCEAAGLADRAALERRRFDMLRNN